MGQYGKNLILSNLIFLFLALQINLLASNFATWNPNDKYPTYVLSNDNLTVSGGAQWSSLRSNMYVTGGKWYFEFYIHNGYGTMTGVGTENVSLNSWVGGSPYGWSHYGATSNKGHGGVQSKWGSTWGVGDVISCALDMDNGKLWWGKNGTWFENGDPTAGTGAAFTGLTGNMYIMGTTVSSGSMTLNAGQSSFAYVAPTGFFQGFTDSPVPEPSTFVLFMFSLLTIIKNYRR